MPSDINIEALAAFVNALVRGLAVQARDGASREKLLEIGRVNMEAWPVANKPAAYAHRKARSLSENCPCDAPGARGRIEIMSSIPR
jgi:hypothetical protein